MASAPVVEWPSGEATACKAVHTGSIPVSTSRVFNPARLAQRESASLTRKRSLVQSQYRAPQQLQIRSFLGLAVHACVLATKSPSPDCSAARRCGATVRLIKPCFPCLTGRFICYFSTVTRKLHGWSKTTHKRQPRRRFVRQTTAGHIGGFRPRSSQAWIARTSKPKLGVLYNLELHEPGTRATRASPNTRHLHFAGRSWLRLGGV